MTRSELARRKRQMNRRIRELVAIRRATMSFSAPAPVRVAAPAATANAPASAARPVTPAPQAGVAIRSRVNARTSLFPQISPPRQLKASAPRSPLSPAKAPLPPVCP
jgi:hypothetical protein